MNKQELITRVANQADVSKVAAERVINALTNTITNALKLGGEVDLRGVGKFSVTRRAEKNGSNPKTGEKITIAARTAPVFKFSKTLKDVVS